jgi:hypothetical protein
MNVFKKILLWLVLMSGTAHATPLLTMGTSDNYCVTTCYIRIPFTITHYESTRNIGMVYCDVDAEVTSISPDDEQARTRNLQQSPIGVFKNASGEIKGEVEVDTGIRKKNFRDAKVKTASCHL